MFESSALNNMLIKLSENLKGFSIFFDQVKTKHGVLKTKRIV